MKPSFVTTLFAALAAAAVSTGAWAADEAAAKATMKQNNCLKCHGIDKEKDGPSYKRTAEKYKGKADAESKLMTHLTTGPKVKLADGSEEEHKKIKATEAETKNLVQYIISLQ
jgi:cytochrome c